MDTSDDRETRLFPDKDSQGKTTCCALTSEFLIFGTDVCIFLCYDLQLL